ncbi:hypothetical protein [Streptomyces orinoci]|uniref:Integral membrane protein n=1 Tax=Streptomyces orinoci TaxID=67339 RepID=A0ABV3JSF3_STRON|nr:hypothetical protein [Streptomyces orinoci]
MNDRLLRAAVGTRVRMASWRDTCVRRMFREGSTRGQTAAEYIGMIVVVVAIMAAVAGFTDIGTTIKNKIIAAINKIAT